MKSRLQEKYRNETVPALMKRFGWKNVMAVPKVCRRSPSTSASAKPARTPSCWTPRRVELGQITGQKPIITRAKKSIANFKIRKGMPIGCAVTLRGDKMYEFLDRLCNVVLPRVRDFRGLPSNAFDGRGNYTLGLKDQLVFPEIDYTRVDKIKGMNITLTTTRKERRRRPRAAQGPRSSRCAPGGATINGTHCKNRKDAQETEIQGARAQPLPLLWPRARATSASSRCAESVSAAWR